jgi:SAM-dependent methyltransferase
MANIDSDGFVTNFNYWNLLWNELLQASQLQCELIGEIHNKDSCYSYAEIYDEVVRKESLKKITSKYIQFIHCKYHLDLSSSRILSIGCGTGIMEEYLLKNYYLEWDNVLGIDTSESMIKLASKRINAFVGDILDIKYTNSCDIAFASLNVFQSFVPSLMEEAIEKTSRIIKNDGYLIADFITSDHIRRYRNILDSENVVLLRKPSLIEESHNIIQQNEVINVAILNSKLQIMYGGKHNYYLPSICQVRYILGKFFNRVDIFDALTFAYLNPEDDTSPSTQYLIVAQK